LPGLKAKETSEMVQNIDIVPTILEFLGEKKDLDGRSLMPLIKEGKKVRDEVLLFDGLANDVRAVRTGKRKLVVAKDKFCNLCKSSHHSGTEEYDLENDPQESKDVFSGSSELSKLMK
jgi:arylsulfatase A-like enzyme